MRFRIMDDRRALREKALTFDEHLYDRALEMLKVGIRGHATSSRKSILGTPAPLNARQINVEEAGESSGKEKPYPVFELARFSASRSRTG